MPAAGDHEPQHSVVRGRRLGEQRPGVGLDGRGIEGEAQVVRGARHALDVLAERVRAPRVQPDDLEDAVAAQQSLVGDRDPRLGDGHDRTVETGELHDGARV